MGPLKTTRNVSLSPDIVILSEGLSSVVFQGANMSLLQFAVLSFWIGQTVKEEK